MEFIETLKNLHYVVFDIIQGDKSLVKLKYFMKLFDYPTVDVNIHKTILIITQSFIDHEQIKEVRESLERHMEKNLKK